MMPRSAIRTFPAWAVRRLALVLLAFAGMIAIAQGAAGAEPEIAARVNGEPVTRAELQRLLNDPLERERLQQTLDASENDDEATLHSLALQKLIQRRLLLQEAGRRNITVNDAEIDQALTALRSRFDDLGDFGLWMKQRGLSDRSLFETIRAQILMTKVWIALSENTSLSEKEVLEYYQNHKQDLTIGDEVRLRIIAVKSKDTADDIMEDLRGGENFSLLAQRRSLGKLAYRGGDTGWVDSARLPPLLRQTVAMLEAGDVAGPLRKASDEFLIVGLADRRPIKAESATQARPAIEQLLLPAKRREAVRTWLAKQEKKSDIQVLFQPGR